ncbi:polyprenyl synthetase family protein [Rubrolithibacter danxiaensis]|uniref:polyprenyl synthetase family protein n=1 Tax=Rubrolithibacter danxiaensis TaxID=3390805 RepID=UPI003BF7E25E
MIAVTELQRLVNQTIADKSFPAHPEELYEPIKYILSLGGKRLRPVLTLIASDLFNGSILTALEPAIGLEMFHNFTLMHDDIMDKAPLRRGKPTVHAKWNEAAAILSGDVMLVEAYQQIMKVDDRILREVIGIFSNTAAEVCEGQQIDMSFEQMETVSIEAYIEMIALKTAVLLGASLKIGALIGGAQLADAEKLYQFGKNLGIAFQLQDDILDVYGDPEKFGKQVGGDIISNKKTFLLIKALELASGLEEEELSFWLNKEDAEPETKVDAVTDIYNRLGIRHLAEEEMNKYAERALNILEDIPAEKEKKQILRSFAEELLVREN